MEARVEGGRQWRGGVDIIFVIMFFSSVFRVRERRTRGG